MILNCPSCSTSFHVDDGHIGPSGRTVRCSLCKHTWKAERAEEQPMELKEAVKAKPDTTDALKALKAKAIPKKYREIVEDQKRQEAMKTQGFVWAGLLVLVGIAIGLGYLFRIDIVRALPATAGAYSALGLKVNGTNLEFESYEATPQFKGGRFVVTVKAKIRNLSHKPTPVPPVRVRLYDKGLEQFATQTMGSAGLIIGAKAVKTMVFDVPDPLNMSTSIDLGFDLEALRHNLFIPRPRFVALRKKRALLMTPVKNMIKIMTVLKPINLIPIMMIMPKGRIMQPLLIISRRLCVVKMIMIPMIARQQKPMTLTAMMRL